MCLVLVYLLSFTYPVYSLPQINEVVNGQADYHVDGNTMTINATNDTIINYNGFNIGSGETVIINLPDSTSRILNRVSCK